LGTALNLQAWSKTPALNDNVDSTIGDIDDEIAVTALDDKQCGFMAALAKYADDIGGALLAAGTANALTVTTNQAIDSAHLTDGFALVVRTASANSSTTVTIAVDGLSAKAIKTAEGGNPAVGQITSGMHLLLFYNSTAGNFRAANLNAVSDTATLGAADASFSAHMNGTDQTISTSGATLLEFDTESFDVGSYFNTSSYRWTPPAGYAMISLGVMLATSPTISPNRYTLKLYKNGALHKQAQIIVDESWDYSTSIITMESVNGTDYFQAYVDSFLDDSYTVSGATTDSWFCGTMV